MEISDPLTPHQRIFWYSDTDINATTLGTGNTYTIAESDVGKTLYVEASLPTPAETFRRLHYIVGRDACITRRINMDLKHIRLL